MGWDIGVQYVQVRNPTPERHARAVALLRPLGCVLYGSEFSPWFVAGREGTSHDEPTLEDVRNRAGDTADPALEGYTFTDLAHFATHRRDVWEPDLGQPWNCWRELLRYVPREWEHGKCIGVDFGPIATMEINAWVAELAELLDWNTLRSCEVAT